MSQPRIKSPIAFYEFYLTQHQKPATRVLHFMGTFIFIVVLIAAILLRDASLIWKGALVAYAFAWSSHAFIEKNKPATLSYPLYSLISDFRFFTEVLLGKRSLLHPRGEVVVQK